MFNSIRKDKNRRNLVKKFEIQRLQNKALFQAISVLENKAPLNNNLMAAKQLKDYSFFIKNREKKDISSLLPFTSPEATGNEAFLLSTTESFSESKNVYNMSFSVADGDKIGDFKGEGFVKPSFTHATSEFSDIDNILQNNVNMSQNNNVSFLESKKHVKILWQGKALKFTPRNSSKNRVRNRCVESGRSRAVLRFCKLSRICLRDKAAKGVISGVNKASW